VASLVRLVELIHAILLEDALPEQDIAQRIEDERSGQCRRDLAPHLDPVQAIDRDASRQPE
jgi:hypothetical protein